MLALANHLNKQHSNKFNQRALMSINLMTMLHLVFYGVVDDDDDSDDGGACDGDVGLLLTLQLTGGRR